MSNTIAELRNGLARVCAAILVAFVCSLPVLADELRSQTDIEISIRRIVYGRSSVEQRSQWVELFARAARGEASSRSRLNALAQLYGLDFSDVEAALNNDHAFAYLVNKRKLRTRNIENFATRHEQILRVAWVRGLFLQSVRDPATANLRRLARQAPSRDEVCWLLGEGMDDSLVAYLTANAGRRSRAEHVVLSCMPPDPGASLNRATFPQVRQFTAWASYPYDVIVVPGYTPTNRTVAEPGVHTKGKRRLEQAVSDFRAGWAPFILVSGGNVYPLGSPYYEAIEMHKELRRMGVPAERVLVDARARHSTTNLRNAGRMMAALGMRRALVTTSTAQDFYFSYPRLSGFYARCRKELGFDVANLSDFGVDRHHSIFEPVSAFSDLNLRDPLDP